MRLPYPTVKSDMVARLTDATPPTMNGQTVVKVDTLDGVKYRMADDSWLLIRPSGTEPVLRVYAEAPDAGGVSALLEAGRKMAGIA